VLPPPITPTLQYSNPSPMLQHELTILLYHHVGQAPKSANIRGLYVTPQQFDWQMRQLQRLNVRFLTCADLLNHAYPETDPSRWVMVTFDDGTRGVYDLAFPVLQKHQIPAVVYPIVGDLGKKQVVWKQSTDKVPRAMMSATQVQEMVSNGIEFGSHLYQHVRAAELPASELMHELSESKSILEELIGTTVLSVAYPFGSYSPAVMKAAQQAGYHFGLSTQRGTNVGRDLLELCRVPIKGTRWHHYWYFRRFLSAFKRGVAT
jgi:peptidoglycan/xylan/chitin deacetylase (PgdA/CDA1 family)